ncbi:MAG TPA: HAMP domain-containing sensor histidine kinase [Chryseosolibacter sp.]
MKFFKAIIGSLFALILAALALLTEVILSHGDSDPSSLLWNSYFDVLVVIIILLTMVFLFIRLNFNEFVKRERHLKSAFELHMTAETKLRKMLNEEHELNKMKSAFIRTVSHELRTPLSVILSSLYLVEMYSLTNERNKMEIHASKIKRSVDHLTSIVNDCLNVSNIESEKLDLKIDRFDLKVLVADCCARFQEFTKKGQQIRVGHAGEEFVHSDSILIANILTKLLSNAVKYSGEDTTIVVSSWVNKSIHLSVRDCGIGIPYGEQKFVFERFYRASNAEHVQGSGLGLFIVKQNVDTLHGSIKVNSSTGNGTEVKLELKNFVSDIH